jgi:hypothetical protein
MAKKDSTIIYNKHVDICSEYLSAEQFGRLMFALMKDEEPDFGDDQMLSMAFAFISLQKNLDDKKYEERCRKNRENGKKGGRPKKEDKKPLKANGFFENPNENDNENDNEKENDDDNDNGSHDDSIFHGSFNNVRLSATEYSELKRTYERTGELIDKVSLWLRTAKNDVPDHYGLCVKFANNDDWPKRRQIEPVRPITVTDPLSDDEQREKVVEMKARLNKAFSMG